jgi:hypothetical protein
MIRSQFVETWQNIQVGSYVFVDGFHCQMTTGCCSPVRYRWFNKGIVDQYLFHRSRKPFIPLCGHIVHSLKKSQIHRTYIARFPLIQSVGKCVSRGAFTQIVTFPSWRADQYLRVAEQDVEQNQGNDSVITAGKAMYLLPSLGQGMIGLSTTICH